MSLGSLLGLLDIPLLLGFLPLHQLLLLMYPLHHVLDLGCDFSRKDGNGQSGRWHPLLLTMVHITHVLDPGLRALDNHGGASGAGQEHLQMVTAHMGEGAVLVASLAGLTDVAPVLALDMGGLVALGHPSCLHIFALYNQVGGDHGRRYKGLHNLSLDWSRRCSRPLFGSATGSRLSGRWSTRRGLRDGLVAALRLLTLLPLTIQPLEEVEEVLGVRACKDKTMIKL